MTLAFQCSLRGADLCLFGGSCANATSAATAAAAAAQAPQTCACPSGFGPDMTLFHAPNCALPDGALLGLAAAGVPLDLVVLALLLRVAKRLKRGSPAAWWAGSLALILLLAVAHLVALVAEGGSRVAASLLFAAGNAACHLMVFPFVRALGTITASPAFHDRAAALSHRRRVAADVANTVACVAWVVTGAGTAAHARDADVATYNAFVLGAWFVELLCIPVLHVVVLAELTTVLGEVKRAASAQVPENARPLVGHVSTSRELAASSPHKSARFAHTPQASHASHASNGSPDARGEGRDLRERDHDHDHDRDRFSVDPAAEERARALDEQAGRFRWARNFSTVPGTLAWTLFLGVPIAVLVLGSLPMSWVVQVFFALMPPSCGLIGVVVLHKRHSSSSAQGSRTSKLQTSGSSNQPSKANLRAADPPDASAGASVGASARATSPAPMVVAPVNN